MMATSNVRVFENKQLLGAAAAEQGADLVKRAIRLSGRARIIVASGNSQLEMMDALVSAPGIDWKAVEVFHMDEYVGMPATHPASFRLWVKTHLADVVHPGTVNYLGGDAADPDAECARYGALLKSAPIDVCFLGFGENGHIAFNDPHEADFNDPLVVKRVTLDEKCRRQQTGEGHFPDLDSVPREALTLTCPTLVSAQSMICSVPDRRKAEAVRAAIEGPISTACPGSILRKHPGAWIYLDKDSASLLSRPL
jgi:glucosamine-6-phosphate deaminase